MLALLIYIAVTGDASQGSLLYNFIVFVVLLATLLSPTSPKPSPKPAAGRRPTACARPARTPAKRIEPDGQSHIVSSSDLRQGRPLRVLASGDTIAAIGEIVEDSRLDRRTKAPSRGESAPVIREAGGDKSSVTGGTKVLSDAYW